MCIRDRPKPILRKDVLDMKDLTPGMILKGTVRNVIDFGAFVDIGVHQDGLVHISQMSSTKRVEHPLDVVSVGDIVDVRVIEDVYKRQVYTEGITKISNEDFAYAKELGSVIKLLATSYSKDGKVYAITAPFMIDSTHPLYNVNDVLNGIYVHGNVLGDVMFFGAGAGKLPTASAVVSDVVDCVKHKGKNVMTIWSSVKQELGDTFDETRKFFVRIKGDDVQAAKAAFGEGQVVKVDEMCIRDRSWGI